jgi:hypothetical protein
MHVFVTGGSGWIGRGLVPELTAAGHTVAPEQAGEYVGFLGGFWGVDDPASAQITRDLLGWEPTRPGLIADLREGQYFD